jgi:putative transposase
MTEQPREGEPPGEPGVCARQEPLAPALPLPFPLRKHPVHGVHVSPDHPTIVFLTLCTRKHIPWLAAPFAHLCLRSAWADAKAWAVGRYVVMPDHIHLFAAPIEPAVSLETWVRYWKSMASRHAKDPGHRWQAGHWDTRLRRGENYEAKWHYVVKNPVRRGLVNRPEDWPYQGELNVLEWG